MDFLRGLAANNNREWYHAHREAYAAAKGDFERWIGELMLVMEQAGLVDFGGLDPKQAMYRIFRDVRFHKDKPPYNPWFSAMLGPQGRNTVGAAYYVRIQPGSSVLGAGFSSQWNGDMMAALRQEIDYNPAPLAAWLDSEDFATWFGELQGDSLKRPPKGYAADHPHVDWLKRKEWWVSHPIPAEQEGTPALADTLLAGFTAAKPMVNYLNEAISQ